MTEISGVDGGRLLSLIERIERLTEEKKGIAEDIKQVFMEAKSAGYDVKAMRAVIKLRSINPTDRREADYMLDTYKRALGLD